jgi:hypothetical protein
MNMIFSTKKGGLYNGIAKSPQNRNEIQRNTRILEGGRSINTDKTKTVSLRNTGGLTYGMIQFVESGLKGCGHCSGAK